MAETTTKIFTVDTGRAISNLKEYKEYLEDLKGTLLGLEKGTDEYNKTAEELREAQQKLNEVMDIARGRAEGVEGSYDNLVAKMRDLKKEWRATADETERADLGKKILEINDKLKDLDASTGNFQRNVGDYKNAFSDAFDKMLGPLGKVGGSLGTLARDVKGMIPLIKTVNSSAITGLKGIKAAIASTGIGLLVIAVGELAANWDAVADALDSVFGGTSKLVMDAEQLKNYLSEANYQLDLTIKKMGILGASEWEINEFRLKQNSKRQEELNKMADQNNKIIEEGTRAERKRAAAANEAIDEEMKTLVVEHSRLLDNREIIKLKEKVADEAKKAKEEEQAAAEATRKGAQAAASWNKEMEALKTKATALGQTLEDSIKNPYEKLDSEYNKNLDLLNEALKKKQISDEQYVAWKEILDKNYAEAWKKIMQDAWKEWQDDEIKKTKDATSKKIKEIENILKKSQTEIKIKFNNEDLENLKPEKLGFFESFKHLFDDSKIEEELQRQLGRISETYAPQIQAINDKIAAYDAEIEKLKELGAAQEEIDEAKRLRDEADAELRSLNVEKALEENDAQEESEQRLADARQQRYKVMATGVESVANLMGNLASMMQNQIQQEVRDGKISEEQAKKKFKTVKALQLTQAVMQTAVGVATALAGAFTTKSGPWDYVLAGIQAASIAAAGAIQIATISRQKFDSSGGNTAVATPNLATVTNEYTPQYIQNVQTQSEISELSNAMGNISPVVTVTDIEDGLQASKVRVEENSF